MLACGCAPLHLKTFLHAHLQQALPHRSVSVMEGLFGDLPGTLERAAEMPLQGAVIALEWSDLDSRLGYRSTARWSLAGVDDLMPVVEKALERIRTAIERSAPEVRLAISLPGLPLPPIFQTAGWQLSQAEAQLDKFLSSFCAAVSRRPGLALVNSRRLTDGFSLLARFDLRSDLYFGFPYTVLYADCLAESLSRLLAPPAPKKGIITDLDDTLWNGIVGEVGPGGVSWDLTQHHHLHALYQNLMSSLAERGILVGVTSKNDWGVVEKCFERTDMLLRPESVSSFEVHWQAKSASVTRILRTWNIAADSVVFVDDSPMELAEVAAAHPGIHCIQFPQNDYAAGLRILHQVRDLCASERISQEDLLRTHSIRASAEFQRQAEAGAVPESFLEQTEAIITFDFSPALEDRRVLELVNKTNQFNLNGIRRTEADWRDQNQSTDSVVAVLSYEDKFGLLGKIAVIQGKRTGHALHVNTWVMSCRAFSRRVEHQCLRTLFDHFGLARIQFDFAPTPKNSPLQEFFEALLGHKPAGMISLSREEFELGCPALFHRVIQRN